MKGSAELARQPRIEGLEVARVVGAVVGRHLHAGEHHARPGGAGAAHDLAQIGLDRRHRLAAQPVVRPERDDQDLGMQRKQPVDARQPAGAGVPRHPGVDDPHRDAALREQLADDRRIGRPPPPAPTRPSGCRRERPPAARRPKSKWKWKPKRPRRQAKDAAATLAAGGTGASGAALRRHPPAPEHDDKQGREQRHSRRPAGAPEPHIPFTGPFLFLTGPFLLFQKDLFVLHRRTFTRVHLHDPMLTCPVRQR